MKYILSIFLVSLFFLGCKEEAKAPYFGYSYFGLEEGRFIEYEVTNIFHDENLIPQHDTTIYKLKTIVGKVVTDNSGRPAREFIRQVYNEDFQEYQNLDLYTSIIDEGRGELVVENQRVIKMVYAISKNKEWNANAFNVDDDLDCYYDEMHKGRTANTFTFDSTVVVEQDNFLSLIDYKRKFEVYANNVGLVEVYYKDLNINNFDTLDIKKGTERFYKLLNYGNQ